MPGYTDHRGLVITSSSEVAAVRYADGIELLVGSSPDGRAMLRGAIDADPAFVVARAALAWVDSGDGGADPALVEALGAITSGWSTATRRERQHVEIVVTALRGDSARARALGSEHVR